MPTAQGLYEWFSGELRWIFLIAVIVVVCICAFKRSIIGFVMSAIGLIVVGMFVVNPDLILDLAEWASSLTFK
ncbi:hypothetical protein [Listeria fleischmannii]|jgi:sugar phosphate permease|uniref:Uncharacterized protein n=1 Tax=Listeria fleischmannii TaxID=1069827 RepID=A0A841YHT8_9LIST|nr:hypothetical protein [Listeria fleischmannii]MBC1399911.1 hypothetical protein [Listeria fleischmannii]